MERVLDKKILQNGAYIALEGFDFIWDKSEIKEFQDMWRKKYSIVKIAAFMNRKPIEVFLLALDLAEHGRIEGRRLNLGGN